jgi:DNA-binding transcriptional regulator GbsR (MarR family)
MSEPSPEEREFLERMGLFYELLGAPRTMGRIYGWLLISDAPHRSITELAAAVGASKASVSTIIRQLEQVAMVERAPAPGSRQHHYRLTPGGWTQILRARLPRLQVGVEAAEYGLKLVGPGPSPQRARLEEFRDYFTFVLQELGTELIRRWEDYATRREAR